MFRSILEMAQLSLKIHTKYTSEKINEKRECQATAVQIK